MEEKLTMDDLLKKEREKKKKKKKLLYSLFAAGIVFSIGYSKGQSDSLKAVKKELKNWKQLNLGGGVTMPLYYHKKHEQGIHVVLRTLESSMAKMEEEIRSLKEVTK